MAKPTTSYSPIAKPATTFTEVAKSPTTYSRNSGAALSWLLNSTVVTLNSTIYLLSGYTSATPNQLSNKTPTAYTAT